VKGEMRGVKWEGRRAKGWHESGNWKLETGNWNLE